MRRVLPLLLLLLVLAGCGASSACTRSTRIPLDASPTKGVLAGTPTPGTWTDVMLWSDSVDQQTALFTVPAEWRIAWNATVTSLSAPTVGLVVTLYNSDGQLVDVAVKTDHASSGNYYAHAAPGNFYLKIQTTEANYTVEVQVMS